MGFVERLRTGKHLRVLRNAERAAPEALSEAKSALREIGGSVIPSLLELLPDPKARGAAREVLDSLLTNENLTAYVDALGCPDRRTQSEIVEILKRGRHYSPDRLLDFLASSDVPRGQVEAVLLARLDSLDPVKLLDALPDFERETRAILFRLIEETADPSVAPKAAALIEHSDWWIRAHMAKLLGAIPGEHAESALTRALGDRNKSVRLRAVKSLRSLRATACVPTLVKVLRDGDLTVQAAAIDALIEIADASAVSDLIEVLKDEDEQARRGAVEVLNEVATAEAIQDLVHALRDADWWVRVRAADALGTIGGERVVEAILGLMDDPDVQVRRYAIEILNTIPDGRSVESLLKALEDEDWWVRERSIDALGRTGDERAVAPLLGLLSADEAAAPLCARALGELGRAEAAAPLMALLHESSSDEVTREAVDALVKIAKAGVPADLHARMESALRDHGVRLEKTRQRPMEIRAGAAQAPPPSSEAVSLVLEKPLERKPRERGPAPELANVPTNVGSSKGSAGGSGGSSSGNRTLLPEEIAEGTMLLDRYRIVRQIGRGGFSTVFLVEDQAISDRVILKILSPHLTEDENMAERFVRELKLARRIAHKNVIRIHDLLQIGRSKAISMEYFASEDLGDLLDREEKLTPERGAKLAIQICAGLGAAHEAGVIHRDVKPANVLVGEDDAVKLVDFGLASVGREMENRLTRTGHLVGTPHYMAPELIRGEEVGAVADLYSFGVMMYEMFSGQLPYDGDNAMAILFRHLDGDAKPLAEIVPGFPEELGRIVMGTMHVDRDQRPETAQALQELLHKAAS
jgi:serine/threonine-protein kinase